MADHTPGPWRVRDDGVRPFDSIRWLFIESADGERIAETAVRPDHEANALLIAAAPDMYAALWAMLNPDETERDVDMALEALHKAEGREP